MFSTLPKTNINFSFTFILSSASAFNLDPSKNMSFGVELKMIGHLYLMIGYCYLAVVIDI